MIPKVREWMVTLESGMKLRVLAPTRRLARMNVRHEGGRHAYADIRSIGAVRRSVGQQTLVMEEFVDLNGVTVRREVGR